ncbi:hypothetical protein [Staphylococcus pseudintermedius]
MVQKIFDAPSLNVIEAEKVDLLALSIQKKLEQDDVKSFCSSFYLL